MTRGKKLRINADITAPEVAVIGPDGAPPERMLTSEALLLALRLGLDLVEINPEARPPVCKLLDYRKWYEAAKTRVRARNEHVEFEIRDNQIKEKE